MLKSLGIKNLTVFATANLQFSPQLNVFVGENGSGKSHLLKVAYAVLAASAEEGRQPNASAATKTLLQTKLAEKLVTVLRPESLGRLARRKQRRERCELQFGFDDPRLNIDRQLRHVEQIESRHRPTANRLAQQEPSCLSPTRELLTIYPGLVPVYEIIIWNLKKHGGIHAYCLGRRHCVARWKNGSRSCFPRLKRQWEGRVELDQNGRFYLRVPS